MNRKRRLTTLLAIGLAVSLFAACGSDSKTSAAGSSAGSGSGSSAPKELTSIKVGVFPNNFFSLGIEVARLGGFFEKNGLKPDFFYVTKGGPEMTSALVGNSLDFGENSVDNLILARKQGLDMVTVAGNVQKMPFSMVLRDGVNCDEAGQPYPAPMKCFEGKTVGVTALGASTDLFTREMLKAAGVNLDNVTFVAVGGPTTAYPALRAGQIDGFLAFEPMQTLGTAAGVSKVLVDLRKGDGPADFRDVAYNTWWALGSTVKNRPDVVAAFQKTIAEANDFIADPANFDQVYEYSKQAIPVEGIDETAYKALLKDLIPTVGSKVTEGSIKAWSDFMLKVGLITAPVDRASLVADGVPK